MTVRSSLGGLLRHVCYNFTLALLHITPPSILSLTNPPTFPRSLIAHIPTVLYRLTPLSTSLTHSYTSCDSRITLNWYQSVPIPAFLSRTDLFYDESRSSLRPLQRSFVIALNQRFLVTVRIDVAYPPYHHTRDYHTIPTLNTFSHTAHPLLVSA